MPTLTDETKAFIVMSLARYDTPFQVVQAVKLNFDVEITRRHVYAYDPQCPQPPASRWRELHAATRQAYLREVAEIGIAQKVVRLAMLDRMAHNAMADNYYMRAAVLLEQAARECGGAYEGRRHTTIVSLSAVPPVGAESSSSTVVMELGASAITDPVPSAPESPAALALVPR